jgi:thioredoxin-related protein
MPKLRRRSTLIAGLAGLAGLRGAAAQQPSPHAIDLPRWFSETFLDFPEDVAEAARSGKRLLVYFGQDGCPYCSELMKTNFSQPAIVAKTRQHFVTIAINIWGDREVTWVDGQRLPEKDFARLLKVQFTPTLLFLDTRGQVTLRLNGYQPPGRFEAVLDHQIAGRAEPLADYLTSAEKPSGRAAPTEQPFLMRAPLNLARRPGGKPLALLVETRRCAPCDEMHDLAFARDSMKAQLARLDVARLMLGDTLPITAPDGRSVDAGAWTRELKVQFTPSVLFFDERGREVFRVDGYTRPYHFESAFEYVASGAYLREPQFQRFIQQRAERQRAAGQRIDLWR